MKNKYKNISKHYTKQDKENSSKMYARSCFPIVPYEKGYWTNQGAALKIDRT